MKTSFVHFFIKMMGSFFLWMRIIRPQTLFASASPVLISLLLCGVSRPFIALLTLTCAISLQILANLINDYYDFVNGTDTKGRTGFKRALAEGEVSQQSMKRACYICCTLALMLGIPLVICGKWFILGIGLLSLFFAWLYSATKYSLASLGIADIFVFLFFGIIPAAGTEYLQRDVFSTTTICCGAVCGLISMCVLLINNLRDVQTDKKGGKLTIPVRFGKKNGERLFLCLILLMPLFLYKVWGLNILMSIPLLGLLLYYKLVHSEGKDYNKCLLLTGLLNMLYVVETAWLILL